MCAAPLIRSSDLDAEIIIIGAGSVGLAFAGALAAPGRRVRQIVLEPRSIRPNKRRWLIAAEPGHALSRFADLRLDRLSMAGREVNLDRLRIEHVSAQRFQEAMLDALSQSPASRVEDEVSINAITRVGDSVQVETSLGRLSARAVLDTRPGSGGHWTQIIKRAVVSGVDRAPGFSLSRASAVAGGVQMEQILTLDDGQCLAEVVRFASPGDEGAGLSESLDTLIADLGGERVGNIIRLVLPIEHGAPPRTTGAEIPARAGTGGLRFGVGIAAVRSTRWAEGAAARFADSGILKAQHGAPAQARAAAALALTKLKAGPQDASAWLNAVMETAGPERALRFLAGTPGWRDGSLAFLRPKSN